VATGAEEEGLIGAVKYIDEREEVLDKSLTSFVNVDGAGGVGLIQAIDRYGIPPVKTAGKLVDDVKSAALSSGQEFAALYSPAGAGYDSLPIAFRGYEAVTLTNCKFDKALWDIHSANDKTENVSSAGLSAMYSLCRAVVGEGSSQKKSNMS
jgi:hypothetical protein